MKRIGTSMLYPVDIPVTLTIVSINLTDWLAEPALLVIRAVLPSFVNKKVLVFKSRLAAILNSTIVPLGPAMVWEVEFESSKLSETILSLESTV